MWQKLKNNYHLIQALIANLYFGSPSKKMTIVGVTGTDGKSTTVNMIYHILKTAGKNVSAISSVNAYIGKKTYDTGFHVTTPSPWQIQKFLNQALESGSQYFVLEATSHGLDQNRLSFIDFNIAVLTNITHEHLDYHKIWDNYLKSKAKLFNNVQTSILNLDDESFNILKKTADGKLYTYSLNKSADFNLKKYTIKLKVSGDFNKHNALAALAAVSAVNINKKTAINTLSKFQGLKGRMDNLDLGQDFQVIIDFAHTPNSLKQALLTLNSKLLILNSKLIAVFGAAGERDKEKREIMGQIAAQYASISILTAEDPRSENTRDICDQIAKGLIKEGKKQDKDFYIIGERIKAIKFAVNYAKNGDVVGLFGKGHEKSMCFGKKEIPWDEFKVAKNAINQKLKNN